LLVQMLEKRLSRGGTGLSVQDNYKQTG